MAINELRGVTVHEIGELKEGQGANGEWKLRPFVIEESSTATNGKVYSEFLEITAWNKATEVLETLQEGDTVDLAYACSSRKQKTQTGTEYWRTGARLINMKVLEETTAAPHQEKKGDMFAPPPADENNDLPF